MEEIIVLLILLGLLIFAIKSYAEKKTSTTRPRIYSQTFTISKQQPIIEGEGVEFISVGIDGTSTIRTMFSCELLEAKRNEFFKGRDYGLHGLQLISSSYKEQKMLLKRFFPEDIKDE